MQRAEERRAKSENPKLGEVKSELCRSSMKSQGSTQSAHEWNVDGTKEERQLCDDSRTQALRAGVTAFLTRLSLGCLCFRSFCWWSLLPAFLSFHFHLFLIVVSGPDDDLMTLEGVAGSSIKLRTPPGPSRWIQIPRAGILPLARDFY